MRFITCFSFLACCFLIVTGCKKGEPDKLRFTGRLVDRLSDRPLSNVWVRIYGVDMGGFHDTSGPTTEVITDANGNFDVSFDRWKKASYYALDANDSRQPGWQRNITSEIWDIAANRIAENGRHDFGSVRYLELLERCTVKVEKVPGSGATDTVALELRRRYNPVLPPIRIGDGTIGWLLREPSYDSVALTGDFRKVPARVGWYGTTYTASQGTLTRTYWAPCGVELAASLLRIRGRSATGTSYSITVTYGSPGALTIQY